MIAMLPRLINAQGAFGIAASLALLGLFLIQKGETRHWRKQSTGFEKLYRGEQQSHAQTVASYRAAAETARRADGANRDRVLAAQAGISERTIHDYEARLGDARTVAERLRRQAGSAAAGRGTGRATPLPAAAPAARAADGPAAQGGLSLADKLTATEQAIQLDELILWVRAQAAVDNQGGN
jgi:hypothetical protein